MHLTPQEKLILHNQFEILKHVNPDDFSRYQEKQEILEIGSDTDCEELFNFLNGTPNEVASEVWDILDMFKALTFSYDKLSDVADLKREDVLFSGFDGNEECSYYIYAQWLIEERNKYQEFATCEVNSHCNRLDVYRKMMGIYNTVKQKHEIKTKCFSEMTLEEIKTIIGK